MLQRVQFGDAAPARWTAEALRGLSCVVIPGWCVGTRPGISRFRVRCFASPRNDGSLHLLPAVDACSPAESIMIAALGDIELLIDALAGHPINQAVLA